MITGAVDRVAGLSMVAALLMAAGCSSIDSAPSRRTGNPMRIVSMNPCTDAILVEIADRNQIAAISAYSQDPRATAISLKAAQQYRAVSNSAEDVIAADPDLILAGYEASAETIAGFKQVGIPVMQVPVPETVAENMAQIQAIADRIGQAGRGVALNAHIGAALNKAQHNGKPVSALIWQGSGLVPGDGTLADELLERTGFRNLSQQLHLRKWDVLPIEALLAYPPDTLLVGKASMSVGDTDANRMLHHPALQRVRQHIHVANFPANLLYCGGPVIIRTVATLAAIRDQIPDQP